MDPMGHKISHEISMKYMKSPFVAAEITIFRCFSYGERPQTANRASRARQDRAETSGSARPAVGGTKVCQGSSWC